MLLALALATLLLLLVTALPLWRHPHWLIRGLDFPRLQFTVFGVGLLCAQLWLLPDSTPTLLLNCITLVCLCWQLWWILPYTPLWRHEVLSAAEDAEAERLSILTANVLMSNHNAPALLALVTKYEPDILVVLESDEWWQQQLDSISAQMPYSVKCPMDNLYGMHLYSRLPLTDAELCFLVQKDVPSIHSTVTLRNGSHVRLFCLHPAPPSPTENEESTERDAELVIVARRVDASAPTVVTGDLNDVAWSSTTRLFRKLSGLLDPRVGRGMFNTFHAQWPGLRWPLDHLFHSDHFRVLSIQRMPAIGSDHFPLLTVLRHAPGKRHEQDGLDAESDDHEQARDILQRQY